MLSVEYSTLKTSCSSMFSTRCSMLNVCCSTLDTLCSMLIAECSMLKAQCPMQEKKPECKKLILKNSKKLKNLKNCENNKEKLFKLQKLNKTKMETYATPNSKIVNLENMKTNLKAGARTWVCRGVGVECKFIQNHFHTKRENFIQNNFHPNTIQGV